MTTSTCCRGHEAQPVVALPKRVRLDRLLLCRLLLDVGVTGFRE